MPSTTNIYTSTVEAVAEEFIVSNTTNIYTPAAMEGVAEEFVMPSTTNIYTFTVEAVAEEFIVPDFTNINTPPAAMEGVAEEFIVPDDTSIYTAATEAVAGFVSANVDTFNADLDIVTRMLEEMHLNDESVADIHMVCHRFVHMCEGSAPATSDCSELDILTRMFAKMNLNDESVTDGVMIQMYEGNATSEFRAPTCTMDIDADEFRPIDVDTAADIDVNSMDFDPIIQVMNDVDCLDWEPIVSEIAPGKPVDDMSQYPTENMPMFSPFQFQSVYRLA